MKRTVLRSSFPALMLWGAAWAAAQIPLERVLSRVTVLSEGELRGLVDTRGFPTTRIEALYSALIDRQDISKCRVPWCGRFAVPFGVNFAVHLARQLAGRELEGRLLRHSTSLSDPRLPLEPYGLGLTSDTNLHHFVTYFAIGFR